MALGGDIRRDKYSSRFVASPEGKQAPKWDKSSKCPEKQQQLQPVHCAKPDERAQLTAAGVFGGKMLHMTSFHHRLLAYGLLTEDCPGCQCMVQNGNKPQSVIYVPLCHHNNQHTLPTITQYTGQQVVRVKFTSSKPTFCPNHQTNRLIEGVYLMWLKVLDGSS